MIILVVKYRMIGFISFLSLVLLVEGLSTLTAQSKRKAFDKETWEEVTKDLDYQEKEKPEKERPTREPFRGIGGSSSLNLPTIGKVLLFTGVALLIGFILYKIMDKNWQAPPASSKEKIIPEVSEQVDQVSEEQLRKLVNEALDQGNYRQAIRLYYLLVLKVLDQNEWITWKKEKTNYHYLRELRNSEYASDFNHLTRIYEKVWYGNKYQSEAIRQEVPHFEAFVQRSIPNRK